MGQCIHTKVLWSGIRIYLLVFEAGLVCLALANRSSSVLAEGLQRSGSLGSGSLSRHLHSGHYQPLCKETHTRLPTESRGRDIDGGGGREVCGGGEREKRGGRWVGEREEGLARLRSILLPQLKHQTHGQSHLGTSSPSCSAVVHTIWGGNKLFIRRHTKISESWEAISAFYIKF